MMSIYGRVKSYALRTGPYLYDMRFLLAGFAITYYGISKIVASSAKSKFFFSHFILTEPHCYDQQLQVIRFLERIIINISS